MVSGWGRSLSSHSEVVKISSSRVLHDIVATRPIRGVTARGLGRSYGDAAINSGGTVAEIPETFHSDSSSQFLDIDSENKRARINAGVSIEQMLRSLVPAGFFVPVTPGTRFVTLGGAIAADIHGKNHHVDGTFGRHVSSMNVMLSNGDVISLDREVTSDWFWATVGGMGLTGVVLDAVVDLIPITTNKITVTTQRARNIDELFQLMSDADADNTYRYSVAWVDMLSRGDSFGRGVLTRGDHASIAQVQDNGGQPVLTYDPKTKVAIPKHFPSGVLNLGSIKAFNEVWYRKAPKTPVENLESMTGFFHPLDGVRQWNRMYGPKGFLQYQCVVPMAATHVLREIMTTMQEARIPSFLAVLKRMGPSNPGFLSFPMEGWTLAVDIAVGSTQLASVLRVIDEKVIDAGGRHYLAKDAHMSPRTMAAGYPQLDKWRDIQKEMDPQGMWTSDLARRLRLLGEQ